MTRNVGGRSRVVLPPLRVLLAALVGSAVALAEVNIQSGQQPLFRSGTEIVRLDVRVTDGQGKPISDLRPSEIEVEDRGRIIPIRLFQHVQDNPGAAKEVIAESLTAEVSTNVGAPRGHLYVLVVDQLHITPGREQRVRAGAERFIRDRLRPGDRVAVYGLPGPGPALNLTLDLERARQALSAIRGGAALDGRGGATGSGMRIYEAYQIVRGDERTTQRVLARLSNDPAYAGLVSSGVAGADQGSVSATIIREEASRVVSQADMESRAFLSLLADVMRTLRQIEGRKSLILFSEGFIIDNIHQDLDEVAAAAAESYSVIYSLDLNSALPGGETERPDAVSSAGEINDRRDPLATLAIETDGRMIMDATHVERVLANVAAAASDYYLIGFEPAQAEDKHGAYRRVKVRIKRPGARVHARTGYSIPAAPNPATRRRTIDLALTSPVPITALPLEYTTYVLRGKTAGASRVVVSTTAQLPPGGDPNQHADVVFVVRDARTGQNVASGTDQLRMPDPAAAPDALTPVPYRVQFEVPPGEYLMRLVVREPGGLVGTADRRFRVRSLWGPGVTGSDLIVVGGDAKRIDPPPHVAVAAETGITVYFEIYGGSEAGSTPMAVEVLSKEGGDVVRRATPLATNGQNDTAIVRTYVPLSGLHPGEYVVRAVVGSGAAVPVTRTFRIVGGASVN